MSLSVWSALGTGGLEALVLPEPSVVSEVLIAADHDPPGLRAARNAARRWVAEGRCVRIAIPPQPGMDFNDLNGGLAG